MIRVPTATVSLDRVSLDTASTSPIVCNRIPSPVLRPRAQTSNGSFVIDVQSVLYVAVDDDSVGVLLYPGIMTVGQFVSTFNTQCSIATAAVSIDGACAIITTSGDSMTFSGGPLTESGASALGLPTTAVEATVAEAAKDADIYFTVLDVGSSGFDRVRVWVDTDGVNGLVYDSYVGASAGWTVDQVQTKSVGSSAYDVWSFVLHHTTDFISSETVALTVEASVLAPLTTTAESTFQVVDYTQPAVSSIVPWSTRDLRVKFSEAMSRELDEAGTGYLTSSVLYTRHVQSGTIAFYASYIVGAVTYYNVVEASSGNFTEDEVGLFMGTRGAQNATNNFCAEILERLSSTLVRVDTSLVSEDPIDPTDGQPPDIYISPYRVLRVAPASPTILPTFVPIVIAASDVDDETIAPSDDINKYALLTLADDLSPSTNYQLEMVKVSDVAGNEVVSTPADFTSWTPVDVPDRDFDLWDMIPQMNKDEDTSRDLEKFIRCLDDATKVMLQDVDSFGWILDPMRTKPQVLDVMLQHLGCPFTFTDTLSTQKKRDLIPLLVPMYKQKGTAEGIEDAVLFFLEKEVTVTPWYMPDDTWELGESELGFNTYLGPSQSFVRYSFYLDSYVELTTDEQRMATEIVNLIRPAHTHFLGFRELESDYVHVTVHNDLFLTEELILVGGTQGVYVQDEPVVTDNVRRVSDGNRWTYDTALAVVDRSGLMQYALPTDTCSVADAATAKLELGAKLHEALAITDLAERVFNKSGGMTDAVYVTDVVDRGKQRSSTVADTTLAVTEVVWLFDSGIEFSDACVVAEGLKVGLVRTVPLASTVTATDTAATTASKLKRSSDTVAVTESVRRTASELVKLTSSETVAEAVKVTVDELVKLISTMDVTESVATEKTP